MVQRRWWLMLLPALVVLLFSIPAIPQLLNPDESYNVTMRFTAAVPAEVADESNYEDSAYVPWLASEYVVVNFPQWITSDSFATEVSEALATQNIDISPEDLRPAFGADSARSIFVMGITWADREEIEPIAETAVNVLKERNETYFPQFASVSADVEALDDIRVNTIAPPLTQRLNPIIRLIIALGAGVALVAVIEYFDDTLRSETELKTLDLTVIGTIPVE